jgi:diacylglycerol kinase family enzyme
LLSQIPAFFNGTLRAGPGLHMTPVVDAVVRSDGPLPFHVDGESYLGGEAIRIATRPGALRVAAPQVVE